MSEFKHCMNCGETISPRIYMDNSGICSKCYEENEENDPYLNIDQHHKFEKQKRIDEMGLQECYYPPSESMEYQDQNGNFFSRNFQRLRNPSEYLPDEDGCYTPFGDE